MIDANAWTVNYGIENIDTIREAVRARTSVSSSTTRWINCR